MALNACGVQLEPDVERFPTAACFVARRRFQKRNRAPVFGASDSAPNGERLFESERLALKNTVL
jgi:hypothetical protein